MMAVFDRLRLHLFFQISITCKIAFFFLSGFYYCLKYLLYL
jgi:hypothetical protein